MDPADHSIPFSADVWALGSIIFYMISGDAPFKSMSEYLTFEKIKTGSYTFPPNDSPEAFEAQAQDLIRHIFVRKQDGPVFGRCHLMHAAPHHSVRFLIHLVDIR